VGWVVKGFRLVNGVCLQMLTDSEPGFPRRLRGLSIAPPRLDVRGILPESDVVVAMVGSRAADREQLDTAHALAVELARAGALIVSGGAIGIDAAAHRGALAGGGQTVAVLGCGIDVVYPARHRRLFDEIVARGGALVTPFAPGTPPRPGHFVRRNAILAGLADAVVVVAASSSSGSLHTARSASALGRVLGAVPGTEGCERLLAAGAALVESAQDVLAALAGRPRARLASRPDGSAARVLEALDRRDPRDHEEVAVRTGLSVRETMSLLCDLELEGLAILLPGGNYVRSTLAWAS